MNKNRLFPGFGLSLGYTCAYLGLIVLIPLGTLIWKSSSLSWREYLDVVTSVRTLAAFRLSFLTAFVSALVNTVFGFLIAWILARYAFPGKRIVDALIDLPFALPTAVAGIALTAIYASTGWIGQHLHKFGIEVAFTPLGIVLALNFIGLPFVVRSVEPVLQELESEVEEAAASLGAGRWEIFRRIIFPAVIPSLIAGFTLAFARGIGEYGSVVFISGNMPMQTEIAPLLIMTKLEQFDYAGATAIALTMLIVSFSLFFMINVLQARSSRRLGMEA
jgi:sulfate transport system permease protein